MCKTLFEASGDSIYPSSPQNVNYTIEFNSLKPVFSTGTTTFIFLVSSFLAFLRTYYSSLYNFTEAAAQPFSPRFTIENQFHSYFYIVSNLFHHTPFGKAALAMGHFVLGVDALLYILSKHVREL